MPFMEQHFKVIRTETVYHGRVLDVRRERVRLPDGRQAELDLVIHSGAVTILPVDDAGRIWFVRQYRHATGRSILELPAGTLDGDEAPEHCARREVREEIGMASDELQKLGEFFLAPGYSTEYMHVFLAKKLREAPLEKDMDEFLNVEQVPVETAYVLAQNGQIQDAKSLAALLLARPYLLGDG